MTFLKGTLKVFLTIFAVITVYWWLFSYHILPGFWNGFFFFLLILGVPLLAFVLYRKNKGVRWYILAVIIAVLPSLLIRYSLLGIKTEFTYDESYLIGDSNFVKNAATVMPSRELVESGTTVFYECQLRDGDKLSIYRLSVEYDREAFESEAARLEAQYLDRTSYLYRNGVFYLDGALYRVYDLGDDRIYAFAYNACSDTRIISYVFFYDFNLSTMDIGNALKYSYDMDIYVPE